MADTLATFGASVLNAQLDAIQNNVTAPANGATFVALCKNYDRADAYGTVVPGKVVAKLAVSEADGFWGARDPDTSGATDDSDAPSLRQACTAVELAPALLATNGTTDELSVILYNASEILAVTNENSASRAVAVDDVITTFAFYIQSTQPGTAV
jgi:hypothetical protein